MVESFVSKSDSQENDPKAAGRIEGLESHQEKPPSENNHGLQLTIAYGGFPSTPTPTKTVNQPNKNHGLDLGLGTLFVHVIPPPQPVNHHLEPGLDTTSLINVIGQDISITCLLHFPRTTYTSIASLNRRFRELIRSGEMYKLRHNNKVIEHWVYFSCHSEKWEAFDPSMKKWMQLPIMDDNYYFNIYNKESMAVGTQLLLLGKDVIGMGIGRKSLTCGEEYDLDAKRWTEIPNMSPVDAYGD
ncbi:unnamed protein product [Lactuca saligna]|uniref:F-box domain-containing protein n=1 Tax=Lactuca saligna TaxID=75948 RepID=A0AA35YL73_LACSI|nr:unnamed protein product [Lactuca saligna]